MVMVVVTIAAITYRKIETPWCSFGRKVVLRAPTELVACPIQQNLAAQLAPHSVMAQSARDQQYGLASPRCNLSAVTKSLRAKAALALIAGNRA
jgi:hypothetical protein